MCEGRGVGCLYVREGEWAVKGSGLFVCGGRGVGCLCVGEGEWAVCV